MDPGEGEQRSQRRMSMSWQDFARSEGAEVDSLRQLPLFHLSIDILSLFGRVER